MLTKVSENIVKYCAPTLAGIKSANLFSIEIKDKKNIYKEISDINKCVVKLGVRVMPLYEKSNRMLIYVYRPKLIQKDSENSLCKTLLKEKGYCNKCVDTCIACLRKRINEEKEYPHEIGLFLGYPPEDVYGFINNKEKDLYIKNGYWRVYQNKDEAIKKFNSYDNCTRIFINKYLSGTSIQELTVCIN